MTGGEKEGTFIGTAHQLGEGQARGRGDEVIVPPHDVEDGTGDGLQVDRLSTHGQTAVSEEVLLQQIPGQLAGELASQRHIALEPSVESRAHPDVILELAIPLESNILVEPLLQEDHGAKPYLEQPVRVVSVDGGDEVNGLGIPPGQQGGERHLRDAQIDGKGEGDEGLHLPRVKGSIDGGQQTAKAIAEQRDPLDACAPLYCMHRPSQIIACIGSKPAPALCLGGWKPIDKVELKPLSGEGLHHTVAALQVKKKRSLKESVDHQQRSSVRPSCGWVVTQPYLSRLIDHLIGRDGARVLTERKGIRQATTKALQSADHPVRPALGKHAEEWPHQLFSWSGQHGSLDSLRAVCL
jgi:hypothetical protein